MTVEEAIETIESAAHQYDALDADVFARRVREDLSLLRRATEPPVAEGPRESNLEYPPARPDFSVPDRYRDNAGLWVVFSAFISCFVDPIEFGVHALSSFQKRAARSEIERVVIVVRPAGRSN
jgi:hypothetical protein